MGTSCWIASMTMSTSSSVVDVAGAGGTGVGVTGSAAAVPKESAENATSTAAADNKNRLVTLAHSQIVHTSTHFPEVSTTDRPVQALARTNVGVLTASNTKEGICSC